MPITDYRDPRLGAVRAEFTEITRKIPGILTIFLYTVDGVGIAFHSLRANDSEDYISAMAHAIIALNGRIAENLKIGKWKYYVASSKEGRCLYLPVPNNQDLVLILVLVPDTSIDQLMAAVRQNWHHFWT